MAAALTDLALAARTNDPRVVQAFAARFLASRLYVPLFSREGVRNRPETAVELGAKLPVHWLELDTGDRAVPLFSTLALCRDCAASLDWKTDGGTIKCLALPGQVAISFLAQALVSPGVDRAVLNPVSHGELHLARTEIETLAAGRTPSSLWFYFHGKLRRPVAIEGASLLGSFLSRADRALQSLVESSQGFELPSIPVGVEAVTEELEPFEPSGPLGALASEIHRIANEQHVGRMDVTVTKSNGRVRIDASPEPPESLRSQLKNAARDALASERGTVEVAVRIDGSSVVLSSSSVSSSATAAVPGQPPPPPPRASEPPSPRFGYLPLEPEDASEEEG